jgi:adenylate cyclase class 2
MAEEREIKLRIADLAALRKALRKFGARIVTPRVHERNVLFDTLDRSLAAREQLLRIRTEKVAGRSQKRSPRHLLTFKRPLMTADSAQNPDQHKVREEIQLQVSEPRQLALIFERLGMRCWFQYEKFRTTFRLPVSNAWATHLLLELDETPIGIFLELEGPAQAIDRGARALGFTNRDYVLANYMVLYREYCRSRNEVPGDMLFHNEKSKRRDAGSKKRGIFS